MKSDQLDKMSKSSKQTIHIETKYDKFDLKGYSCELSANSFIPISRKNQIKERNFFNNHQNTKSSFIYDKIFEIKSDFNPKAHRDDRQNSNFIGLNQAKEEDEKSFPSRSSSEYGRRHKQFIDFNNRSHLKIDHVKKDFYRNNGII